MKKYFSFHTLAAGLFLVMSLSACGGATVVGTNKFKTDPNSPVVTRTVSVEPKAELVVATGLNVQYVVSGQNNVVITAPEDIQEYIKVDQNTDNVYIYLKKSPDTLKRVKIAVNLPAVNEFSASSGASITLPDGFAPVSGKLEISASSGALISGKDITAHDVEADVSSGAQISCVNLVADKVEADASSGANFSIDCRARSVEADVSSGASGKLTGTAENADLSASSAASLSAGKLLAKFGEANASSGAHVECNISSPESIKGSSGGSVTNKAK